MKAFILIETLNPAKVGAKEVAAAVKQLAEVKSADVVMGPYDVMAIVEAESMAAITARIEAIPGISRTVVCTCEPSS